MSKKTLWGNLAVLATTFIYAFNTPFMKSLMPEWLNGWAYTVFRQFFAAAAFWILSFFLPREKVNKKHLFYLFIGGLFGLTINQIGYTVGLDYSGPIDATIIRTFTPIMVVILGAIFLHTRITVRMISGMVIGTLGALTAVIGSFSAHLSDPDLKGNLIILISVMSFSVYLIVVKPMLEFYSVTTIMKWMFTFALAFSLPAGLDNVIHSKIFTDTAPWHVYLRLGYSCLAATFLTYILNSYALRAISPLTESMYSYIQPIITSLVAIFLFGQDTLSWKDPLALVLIFTGFYLVEKKGKSHIPPPEKLKS